MSYLIEFYLNYLDDKMIYEEKFLEYVNDYLTEVTTDQISTQLGKTDEYIKALMAQRSRMWKMPEVVKKIDDKLARAAKEKASLNKAMKTAEPSPGPDTPVPGGEVTPSPISQIQQKAGEAGEYIKQKAGETGKWAQQKAAQAGEKFKAADAWAKEKLGGTETGQAAMKGLEKVGGQVSQKTTQPLPSGAAGPPQQVVTQPGTGVAGGVETGLQKIGVSPDTAAKVGTQAGGAAQTVASSPLGMAALGGAAAFGGYKLYKRFLSKSARACRGYSGSQKTACMKSYMDAKRGQASSRGVEAIGQGAVSGAS
jgi:hypothetical protein